MRPGSPTTIFWQQVAKLLVGGFNPLEKY